MTASQATTPHLDADGWVRRWERQQEVYVPERESTFTLMLDILERLGAVPGRAVDLGCGPGSLAARVLARWPVASVTAVDLDPVLMELGRRTIGDRVRWAEADLRKSTWTAELGQVDSVLSATALHWLGPEHVAHLANGLASLLRPGGVFLDYDTMPLAVDLPRLRALSDELRLDLTEDVLSDGTAESWAAWWESIRKEPALVGQFAERDQRFTSAGRPSGLPLADLAEALRAAGFREVAAMKQIANRHLLVAIR